MLTHIHTYIRTTEAYLYYKLTNEPSSQVSLMYLCKSGTNPPSHERVKDTKALSCLTPLAVKICKS